MQSVKFLLSIACVQSFKTFNNCNVVDLPLINPNQTTRTTRSKVIYIYVVMKLPVMWTISANLLYISLISSDKY